MITASQILAHLWGDYILQSDWMAQNKTKASTACLAHVLTYSACFGFFHPSWRAWLVIAGTHFLIDRFRSARYLVWVKNHIGPKQEWRFNERNEQAGTGLLIETPVVIHARTPPFSLCQPTGYPSLAPAWLSVWLLIIADNIIHITINGAALRWL